MRKIAFVGKWLAEKVSDDGMTQIWIEIFDCVNSKKQLFVLSQHENKGIGHYEVFTPFDEMTDCNAVPYAAASLVAETLNINYKQFLDI
ncbi:MAG TPA: hypothetical protein VEF53_20085 [Patescibacteria group bacterium]|nr:hypothetical protein [Patescibacteria group bacterium]